MAKSALLEQVRAAIRHLMKDRRLINRFINRPLFVDYGLVEIIINIALAGFIVSFFGFLFGIKRPIVFTVLACSILLFIGVFLWGKSWNVIVIWVIVTLFMSAGFIVRSRP